MIEVGWVMGFLVGAFLILAKATNGKDVGGKIVVAGCSSAAFLTTPFANAPLSEFGNPRISGEVFGDFAALAKQALSEGHKGVAAVLASAALRMR